MQRATEASLKRIVGGGRRFIPEVDGLRFVAIAAVVLFHLNGFTLAKHMDGASIRPGEAWLVEFLSLGHYGVHLFFVLSGFLLSLPFAKAKLGAGKQPALRSYFLRRLTRLEPPYIAAMLLWFIGGLIAKDPGAGFAKWPHLLASLGYQHNLIYGEPSTIAGVAWSLEIEVQFYILAPLLAGVFALRNVLVRRALLFSVMIAVPVLREAAGPSLPAFVSLSLPGFLEFFVAGFLLTDFFVVDWDERPSTSVAWDAASLLGWPLLLGVMLSGRFTALIAPLILTAYVGAFRGKLSSWLFSRSWITSVGGMCYSMYLLHYAVISAAGRFTRQLPVGTSFSSRFAVEMLVAIPAVLAATVAYFMLLEKPCMDPAWGSRLAARFRSWAGGSRADVEPAP